MTMSIVLKNEKTTPERWIPHSHKPSFPKGRRVRVIPADNQPVDSGIVYWMDEPEVADHPYGIAIYREDFDPQSVRQTEQQDLLVCVDCILYIANGDLPDDRPDLQEDINRNWPKEEGEWEINCGDSDKDEEFSWHDCDTCGSPLGGSRHHVIAWKEMK